MLKELIKTRGVKQKWLASKLGVSEVTVSNWCSGKTAPNVDHLEKLSAILDVEVNVLKNING
ncbi:helix-turn-helix transcriptional regulator [Pontibacter sp. MBLB2868]|uniref:helix-turn-helix transcriptional regulator n=1 Tax=Pontibacter sp. MBLB2868 TaxID=3451555 RepID=UPI003F75383C